MYLRAIHADASTKALRQLIRENPLGILTTAISSPNYPLMQCTHIPFLIDVENNDSETEFGVLRGHLARQNPHSKAMIEAVEARAAAGNPDNMIEQEAMVLFTLPANHYVTPKFYTETKPATGKVVPTWNYAAAQVYGKAKIYCDSKADETGAFLSRQVADLSQHAETQIMGHTGTGSAPGAWKVSDAPDNYIKLLQKNIIGIEITIDRLEGKFKMSQEMSEGDRAGVAAGFDGLGSDVGTQVAEIVRERGEMKAAKAAAKASG